MEFIPKNKELIEIFKNKSVAIVGPAKIHYGDGEYIDNHDIVIRLNSDFNIEGDRINYCGKKCDVVLFNCNHMVDGEIERVEQNLKSYAPKYMITRGEDNYTEEIVKLFTDAGTQCIIEDNTIVERIIEELNFPSWSRRNPSLGFVAIYLALSLPIKKLFIAGITFYIGEIEDLYVDGHVMHGIEDLVAQKATQAYQFEWFVKHYKYFQKHYSNKITVDPFLEDLIKKHGKPEDIIKLFRSC